MKHKALPEPKQKRLSKMDESTHNGVWVKFNDSKHFAQNVDSFSQSTSMSRLSSTKSLHKNGPLKAHSMRSSFLLGDQAKAKTKASDMAPLQDYMEAKVASLRQIEQLPQDASKIKVKEYDSDISPIKSNHADEYQT